MSKATYDGIQWQSPLAEAMEAYPGNVAAADNAGVVLREAAFSTHINLRGDSDNPEFVQAVLACTGVELPVTPNTYQFADHIVISWMSPDEWLITAPRTAAPALITGLQEALAGQFVSIVDVSHGYTAITLTGEHARDVLRKGTPLDISTSSLAAGQCAQSGLAKTTALFWAESDQQVGVIVRRSYADYVWQWLINAAKDYGVHVDKTPINT